MTNAQFIEFVVENPPKKKASSFDNFLYDVQTAYKIKQGERCKLNNELTSHEDFMKEIANI